MDIDLFLYIFSKGEGVRGVEGESLRKASQRDGKSRETQGRDGAISQGELSFISRDTSDD